MTQISLKLFNKLPFTRNEIGGLPRAGRASMWFYPRGRGGGSSSGLKIRRPKGMAGDRSPKDEGGRREST